MEESNPSAKALFLYLSYWRRTPFAAAAAICFSLCLAARIIVAPLLIAITLNELVQHNTVNTTLLAVTAIFLFVVVSLAYFLDKYGVAVLHMNVQKGLYEDSFKYLVYQDYSFFADRFSGSIVTQASRFAKAYTVFNDIVFFDLIPQTVVVLAAVGIMTYYSPIIGIPVFIVWIVSIMLVARFALKRLPLRRGAVAKESEQIGELADTITNALTVKTFASEESEIGRYDKINVARGWLFMRSWRRAVRNAWILEALCAVLQIGVITGGILAVKNGQITLASFLLFQVYILRIIDNIGRSTMVARQLEAVSGDAQEMADLLEQPPLIQDKPFSEEAKIKKGEINFQNVGFQYADAGLSDNLFDNLNLSIKAGEKIGLVGPSGGGKTTVTRLLLRFMDIQSGAIKLDGHDIRDIKQHDLRRAIAYVPQEPLLFHRSIKDNIAYGKPGAKQSEIETVAKKAFAHDFISALPKGYDTFVGERGVKLSGGQRQRIAIARAMLADAPILVLDEATSALDSESERSIQKAILALMKDKTAVVIAHRLSTIQRMDRIVVLDKGKIIESGTHRKLLENQGLYAKLWSHQSGGFIEE
jgi:ATP-binding cassette subfamily B protein